MHQWKCVIADDEPIARNIIETYCSHLPYLQVVASVSNALELKSFTDNENVDILFLDINMPVISGLAFLKTLKKDPKIIFTTAYKEYAIDAFDLDATDYLLKPFSFERFIIAVDKGVARLNSVSNNDQPARSPEESIFIRCDGKIYNIAHDDLLYAEASGNYTKLVMLNNLLMPAMTFSSIEELLPKDLFVRVHRSFLINKKKISHIQGNRVFINKTEIPISINYKETFLKELGL